MGLILSPLLLKGKTTRSVIWFNEKYEKQAPRSNYDIINAVEIHGDCPRLENIPNYPIL
jgi:hypothetical protein